MIPQLDLQAKPRARSGKAITGKLRRAGEVPVVLYGGKEANRILQIVTKELTPVLRAAEDGNVLVNLKIQDPGGETARLTIVKDRVFHPVDNSIVHVDFFQVALSDSIDVRVPIESTGTPAGIKDGGVVVRNMRSVRVRGKISDIPDKVTIDIANLTIGKSYHVSDLVVPAGIKVLAGPTEAVVSVSIATELAEVVPVEGAVVAAEATQPEVIGEKERLERQAAKTGGAAPAAAKAEAGKPEAGKAGAKPEAGKPAGKEATKKPDGKK